MSSSVLCTGNATYQLKDVQQSNSLLFLSANHDADNNSLNIEGEADSWLKTSLVPRPSVQLSQIPLYDGESDVTGVSVETVFSSFPASNFELERELEAALCVEIDSMYVKLESSYALRMIRFIINSVLAAGMALQQIEEKAFREAIADEVENLEVLIFLLRRFSSKKTSPYDLDVKAITQYAGLHSLITGASRAPLTVDTFRAKWATETPIQFKQHCGDLALLTGYFIQPVLTQIRYFSKVDLSDDPKLRMNQLLDAKDRWNETDMKPFLEDICTDSKAMQSAIMKYAKKVKIGKTTFIERRG